MLAEEREKQIKKDIQIAFTKLAVYSSRRKKESRYTKTVIPGINLTQVWER